MRYHHVLLLAPLLLLCGCAAFNRTELHTARQTTVGQELIDLKKAKDQNLLTDTEYQAQRERLMKWPDNVTIDASSTK